MRENITTFPLQTPGIYCKKYGEEHPLFSLPPGHALSAAKGLHFNDLDGETILLFSKIGFWHEVHQKKMPAAHFLVQDEQFAFTELVKASALPSFTSDLALKRGLQAENRVVVPIPDEEAHASYYCSCRMENKEKLAAFFKRLPSASQ